MSIASVKPGGLDALRCRLCSMSGRPSCPLTSSALSFTYSAS